MAPSSEKVEFTGALGARLAARLDRPATPPVAYALFAHCFTCSKDTRAATYVAAALAERGIACLRFDFTGLGGSDGDFANTDFSSNVADLVAAADFLRAQHRAPDILIGHSLGGAAVLAAAAQIAEARAVATIGAPFEPKHVLHLIKDEIGEESTVDIGGRPFRLRRQFVDDLQRQDPSRHIAGLQKALLIMHAPGDDTVGIDNAARIFMAAKHPKSFVSLDGADHLLTRAADAAYAAEVLAAWSSRYLS
jgi:putative redox protein